ncbi:hypothetical protein FAIPA1_390006 [Frankia sp. AiPs1]
MRFTSTKSGWSRTSDTAGATSAEASMRWKYNPWNANSSRRVTPTMPGSSPASDSAKVWATAVASAGFILATIRVRWVDAAGVLTAGCDPATAGTEWLLGRFGTETRGHTDQGHEPDHHLSVLGTSRACGHSLPLSWNPPGSNLPGRQMPDQGPHHGHPRYCQAIVKSHGQATQDTPETLLPPTPGWQFRVAAAAFVSRPGPRCSVRVTGRQALPRRFGPARTTNARGEM